MDSPFQVLLVRVGYKMLKPVVSLQECSKFVYWIENDENTIKRKQIWQLYWMLELTFVLDARISGQLLYEVNKYSEI